MPSINKAFSSWALLSAFLLTAGFFSAGFLYWQKVAPAKIPTEIAITPAPSATETPLNKSAHTLTVLNGSGIAGWAGSAQELLENNGFTVESVGNADSYDYQTTVIQAEKNVDKKFIEELKRTLEKTYETEQEIQNIPAGIIVIIGENKK